MLGAAGRGKGNSPPHAVQKQEQELLKHPLWENIPVPTQRKALHKDQLTCVASRQQDKSRATQNNMAEDRVVGGSDVQNSTRITALNPWSDEAFLEGSSSLSERAGLLPVWWDSPHARQVVSKAKGFVSSLGLMVDAQHLAPAVGMLHRARESQQLRRLPQLAWAAEPAQLASVRTTPWPSGRQADTALNHALHTGLCPSSWQLSQEDAWASLVGATPGKGCSAQGCVVAHSHPSPASLLAPQGTDLRAHCPCNAEDHCREVHQVLPDLQAEARANTTKPSRQSSKQDEKAASLAVGAGNPAGSIKPSLTARQPKAPAQTSCRLGCQAPVRSTHALSVTQHQR